MASKEARERKEIGEIAEGGKMIAREALPDGPSPAMTLADMEEYAMAASRALVKGTVEYIGGEMLAVQIGFEPPAGAEPVELKLAGHTVTVYVKRVA